MGRLQRFYVDKKVRESEDVTSFYLKPKDGKGIAHINLGNILPLRQKFQMKNILIFVITAFLKLLIPTIIVLV